MIEVASRFLIANLVAGFAVLIVLLARKPVRAMFGARLAYALWLLVPLAALASFLPPRVIETVVPAFDFAPLPAETTPPAVADVTPLPAGEFAAPAFVTAAPTQSQLDPWTAGALAWIVGVALMAAWLAFGQSRFMLDASRGRAGPAVVGVIRPRIVTPSDFENRFDERERDVILAHERIHLDRNDARTNAFVALLRCICWFNPLIHVAAHIMRIDQEMACDAMVVERYPRARGLYASALLKAQLAMRPLPLGCYWPAGGDHPLTERIEMLKQTTPGRMRRLAGVACLAILAAGAGFAAWAAMPPQERFVTADTTLEAPAADPAPEPQSPQQTPAPAPMQPAPQSPPPQSMVRVDSAGVGTFTTRPIRLETGAAIYVHGRIERLEFGANSYVVSVRASSLAPGRYDGGRGGPVEPNAALWVLSPTNYFGNQEAIEADLKGKEVEVRGLNLNADCKPDCRIKVQDLYFARSSEVPAPNATDSVLASFASWYDTSKPNLASGKVERLVFHDNNRTFDIYMRSPDNIAFPSRIFQVRLEYRHPRADIERELTGKTITAGGWRAREVTNTFCEPCGMFSDSIVIQSSIPGAPGVRFTPDGAVLTALPPAIRPILPPGTAPASAPASGAAVSGQLGIVALRRERLEISSRDVPKFVDRYFEPGEEYAVGGAYGGDWTVSTPDGSAFEWRRGNTSLGPIGAGPVNAQSIVALSQRAAQAAAQRAAPQPAAPQAAPPTPSATTPQPTRYEPQQSATAPELDGLPWILKDRADANAPLSLRGTITAVEWINPAVRIHVREVGTGKAWVVETTTVNSLLRLGGTRAVVAEGVAVTARGFAPLDKTCTDACLMYAAPAWMTFSGAVLKPPASPSPQPTRYEPQQAPPRAPPPDIVAFATLFDADDPIQVRGKITKVDLTQPYLYVFVQASEATAPAPGATSTPTTFVPNTSLFRVMFGRRDGATDGPSASLVGKDVTIRGYRAKDKACADACLINGRDLTIEDVKRNVSPASPSLQPTRYEPQQAPPDQPIKIRADHASVDEANRIATYTGNVEVSLGADRVLTGDRIMAQEVQPSGAGSQPHLTWTVRAKTVVENRQAGTITLEGNAEARFGSVLFTAERLTMSGALSRWVVMTATDPDLDHRPRLRIQ